MRDMTPKEVQLAALALQAEIGSPADVYAQITRFDDGKPAQITAYSDGICNGMTFSVCGESWLETFSLAHEKWAEVKERTAAGKIERMALEIIRITAVKGTCQGADLRTAKFSNADIDRYGTLACAKADAMANNGPFSIAAEAKANAA